MARHSSPLNSTAARALIALATASAALGAGAATASADSSAAVKVPVSPAALGKLAAAPQAGAVKDVGGDISVLRGAGEPHGNGVEFPLSEVTGPVTQTGPVGAVPALEDVANMLSGGGLSGGGQSAVGSFS